MRRLYGVYGVGGFGREVMPLVRRAQAGDGGDDALVFVDDGAVAGQKVNGHDVVTYDVFLHLPADERLVALAIADGAVRRRLAERCAEDGVDPFPVVADSASFLDDVQVGEGGVFCGYAHVTSNVTIGRHFHANYHSYLAHDCVVGDFVTLAPGAKVNGNVVVEDGAYIGSGAVIRQGSVGDPMVIGSGALVGMGAVVTRDVAPGAVVVGNPARAVGSWP